MSDCTSYRVLSYLYWKVAGKRTITYTCDPNISEGSYGAAAVPRRIEQSIEAD